MLLTKQDILASGDIKTEDVAVPEWGGSVRVKTMSGRERDAFEAAMVAARGDTAAKFENLRARFCALVIIDEQGARVFDDSDIVLLGQKSAAALDRVYAAAQRLNALSEDDVEALTKN